MKHPWLIPFVAVAIASGWWSITQEHAINALREARLIEQHQVTQAQHIANKALDSIREAEDQAAAAQASAAGAAHDAAVARYVALLLAAQLEAAGIQPVARVPGPTVFVPVPGRSPPPTGSGCIRLPNGKCKK